MKVQQIYKSAGKLLLCFGAGLLLFGAGCDFSGKPKQKQEENPVKTLQAKAVNGDVAAMVRLGRIFLNEDEGVEVNYAEALKWFDLASAKGSAEAMACCGLIYQNGGYGVEKDEPRALLHYKTSAEKGDKMGQYLYGQCLLKNGDLPEAKSWIEKAAEQGLIPAQLEMADIAFIAEPEVAVKWYKRAADQDCATAMNNLAYIWAEQGKELDKALILAGKAVNMEPDNGCFSDTLGWVLFKKGRYDEALGRLTAAAKIDPENEEILDHLGEACFKLGKKTDSAQYWTRAIEQSEDQEFKHKIQNKLNSLKK
ncbi:MAG: tetratricopeptide repeat protein [Victivallaceae bacterium]